MMSFAVLIYPLRSNIRPLDVCFASLDRPEDRPKTLQWIVTQVIAGYLLLSIFNWSVPLPVCVCVACLRESRSNVCPGTACTWTRSCCRICCSSLS